MALHTTLMHVPHHTDALTVQCLSPHWPHWQQEEQQAQPPQSLCQPAATAVHCQAVLVRKASNLKASWLRSLAVQPRLARASRRHSFPSTLARPVYSGAQVEKWPAQIEVGTPKEQASSVVRAIKGWLVQFAAPDSHLPAMSAFPAAKVQTIRNG